MSQMTKFKVWWDEKESIIRNKSWGDFEEKDAKEQADLILSLFETQPGKVLVLNDLTEAGTASSKARKIFSDLMKEKKIKKQAFIGMRTTTRVIISFILNLTIEAKEFFF